MDEFKQPTRDVTVVELLDRLVDHGVVLSGDIRISVADVDLIEIGLRLLIRTPLLTDTRDEEPISARTPGDTDDLALRVRPATERD
jgi:hypothetical protein